MGHEPRRAKELDGRTADLVRRSDSLCRASRELINDIDRILTEHTRGGGRAERRGAELSQSDESNARRVNDRAGR